MTELGQLSLYLVTGAMTAYLVSMIAFAIDLTRKAPTLPVESAAPRRRVAVVVASGGAGDVASVPDPQAESAAPTEPPAAASGGGGTDDGSATGAVRRFAGIGMATFTLGAFLLVAGVVVRGFAAGQAPWSNMYEFTCMAVAVASAVFLVLQRSRDVRYLGTFVAGVAVLALFLALAVLYLDPAPVQDALQSYWLVIHVSVATAAMGVLAVGALFSALQLLKDRSERRGETSGRVLSALPPSDTLERIAYRLNAVGFVLWTFTLIAGAIWAEHAWGRYWGWDAKEVWTFVVWVIYAAYLHARATRGWEGRRAGWFSLAGFASILVNYYVVNLFVDSLHSYSGV